MLNGDTKRKIQGARDILVGKIPVPTAQVEQITLALMYKFMSDMDEQAKKLGDKTGFFMGEYEKYSWNKITDTSLSAYDRVALYSEGLEKMNNNPNVPQLFRDIFKGAFLPFKDPETLKLFLDQINEIEYTHSEDLGDAYEYLLSVMGSQGDAGQFRTPRHIIDFIVEIVDPKKEDKILDPACGTAGFLISAYKHILKHNTTKDSKILGDALSPMDRRNLTRNFVGYDISHEMRRLSLVNMYLHQFPDPQIYEYDTLTSTDHWDEDFDCILANPPFMTPKGGIRPHNRFAIQAKRAEVLFVDYIMEHLSTTGKAGIIVPEGIIFQSSNAYKNLRKLLVEDNYLWGVISLPAGVFQPYSGVKTSVLLLDKNIAKKTENILFVNVESDGFDLSTNRKENGNNDLPSILESLKKYKEWVLNEGEIKEDELFNINMVEKSKIEESGDYNLSGNRYQSSEIGIYVKGKWESVALKDLCDIQTGKKDVNQGNPNGKYPFFTCAKDNTFIDTYTFDTEALLIAGNGDVGSVKYYNGKFDVYQRTYVLHNFKKSMPKYLFYILGHTLSKEMNKQKLGNTMPYIKLGMLQAFEVPVPPIEEQKKIVEELDRYQRIIDGAKMVIDNWKPEIELDWGAKTVRICDCPIKIIDGDRGKNYPHKEEFTGEGYCLFLNTKNVTNKGFNFDQKQYISKEKDSLLGSGKLEPDDLILTTRGTLGNTAYYEENIFKRYPNVRINSGMVIFRVDDNMRLLPEYLYCLIRSEYFQSQIKERTSGSAQPQIPISTLKNIKIFIPTLNKQEEIIKEMSLQESMVSSSYNLKQKYEKRAKHKIDLIFNG